ncbi:MAG: globin domain-containing protein [Nitritalea sp.]
MEKGQTVYEHIGEAGIRRLVALFYQEVQRRPTLRALYPEEDLGPAEERLYWFLLHVFGGPHTYLEKRGHPMLRKRHFQWKIDGEMRRLWLDCMLTAMDKVDLPYEVREYMQNYFIKVANHMINST